MQLAEQTSFFLVAPGGVTTPSAAIVSHSNAAVTVLDAPGIVMSRADTSYSYTLHRELFSRLGDGLASLEEYREGFQRLIMNEAGIKDELSKMKKDDILKLIGSMGGYHFKSEKKERCVLAAFNGLITRFMLHRTLSYMFGGKEADVVAKTVAATTQQDLLDYATEVAKARTEYVERAKSFVKAMQNPETLEEFDVFIRKKGDAKLSTEQRAKYDELRAQANRENTARDLEYKAVAQTVKGVDTEMTIIEGVHTKKNVPIFTVKMSDRVDRSVYLELKKRALKLGGYYSTFRGNGAIPGFIFQDRDSAEMFVANDQVSVIDKVEAKKDEKQLAAAKRLKDMANKMEEKGNAELSRDRQVNTGRRARMAASAEAKASGAVALAQTMRHLAEAIESGEAVHLGGIRSKAQVEMLILFADRAKRAKIGKENPSYSYYENHKYRPVTTEDIDCVEWPEFSADKNQLMHCVNSLSEVHGGKGMADELRNKAAATGEHERVVIERHQAERILDKLKGKNGYGTPGWWEHTQDELKRLDSMGITELPVLRAALREFVQFRSNGPKVDRAKELERKLVGCKIPGFFPTPRPAVDRVIEIAEIKDGMEVLDPEAGSGNIAGRVRELFPAANLSVIEINSTLREILKEKGFNLVGHDFLDHQGIFFDRILMNPPFEGGQDMEHIRHAYSLLKPRGRVVSICSEGPFFRNDRLSVEFRVWLDEVGGATEDLDAGTFMDRTQVRTTGVKSRIVVVNKTQDAS